MSVFNWQNKPSQSGKDLGRIDVIRSAASKTVDKKREEGINLGLIQGLSKKAAILANRHGGQYSRAQEKQK